MSQRAKAQEQSMEEILASIRRIISEDDGGVLVCPKPAPAAATADAKNGQHDVDATLAGFDAAWGQEPDKGTRAEAEDAADAIELAEATQAKAPAFNGIDRSTDVVFDEAPGSGRPRTPDEPRAIPVPDRPLLSPRTTAAVDAAFNSLAHTVLTQNSRTLDDLVREMLKPMLKAWLDDNLPNVVERLVRAEIERVSRGRG
jgi:cell pole-organizing protein PopZ